MSTLHLDKLLDPRSIVVIGASARPDSLGFRISKNLMLGGYSGDLWLVNPRYKSVLEHDCLPRISSVPAIPELAIVLTPTRLFKSTLIQCAEHGIRIVMVMTGASFQATLVEFARSLGIRLIGPHSTALIRPSNGLNASTVSNPIAGGSLGLVSQSNSLGAAMLDWAKVSNVGFSAVLLTGKDVDITLADLIDLLTEDSLTKAIIVYVERVSKPRSFLSALSAAARIKPVVLMRSTKEGARYCDVIARTGRIYSSDDVFQAALTRTGVVRIRTFQNLYAAAKILSTGIRVKGNRLAIVSNGAAPAMMAVERLEIKQFPLPRIDDSSLHELSAQVQGNITGTNPLVLRKPANLADHYVQTLQTLGASKNVDAILLIFIPDSRNNPTTVSEAILKALPNNKPTLICWMGDASVRIARDKFSEAGVSSFRTPESAVDGFDFLHRYYFSQQQLLQLPNPASRKARSNVTAAKKLVKNALNAKMRVLDQAIARELLELFDISTSDPQSFNTGNQSSQQEDRLLSASISNDATFGPTLSVGIGGSLNALISKPAVQLPPLNKFLAEELLQHREIKTYMAWSQSGDTTTLDSITHVLRRLSEIACELPEVFSFTINSLRVSSTGVVASDLQVVLEKARPQKHYEHLAIHPYPWQWIRSIVLKNKIPVQLRPIRPEDAQSIIALVREMSAESRYFRFMHAINELTPRMTAQFTKLDYDRQMAFVASNEREEIIGVSRYIISNDRQNAEFAISISEQWKGQGLATALMKLLIEHASAQDLKLLHGDVLQTNTPMQALMKSLGFTSKPDSENPNTLIFQLNL